MSQKARLLVACVIALVGLSIAAPSLYDLLWPRRSVAAVPPSVSPLVLQALAAIQPDTAPTAESVEADAEGVAARVLQVCAEKDVVAPSSAQGIGEALRERLLAVLAPDFERDNAAKIARGSNPDPAFTPSEDFLASYARARDHAKLAPLSAGLSDVRWIYRQGVPVVSDSAEEGWAQVAFTTRGRTRMDISDDARSARLDILEVRVPMMLLDADGARRPTIVGFQFGWNSRRGEWIPYQNVVYHAPGVRIAALPF